MFDRQATKLAGHNPLLARMRRALRMANEKLRRMIIVEAARMMYERRETEYYRAKMKAGKRLCHGWVKPSDIPSNAEIRDEIQRMAWLFEGNSRFDKLRDMRMQALRMMHLLKHCKPKIIGSTLTGHVRQGSDIDIHCFVSSTDAVTATLDIECMEYDLEFKQVRKNGEERVFTHIHVRDQYPIELTLYPSDKASYVFKSSITGKAMERATLPEYEAFLREEYPDIDLAAELESAEDSIDRFQVYRSLLLPLDGYEQSKKYHPEGDVLYHSLQVYELARDELPYDEEFVLAALLHDVGKGIDPSDHVAAGLEALDGHITERTAWFIEHHMEAHLVRDRTIGHRAHRRLRESPDYEELMILEECDHNGRQPGAMVCDLDEALDYIRDLARQYG
jgi:hypothetical protein